MSGYEKATTSALGGGVPGKFEAAFGNTMTGGEVALNRRKLRKAFKTNNIAKAGNIRATCGPFRSAYQLGDVLGRKNKSCGGASQVNGADSVSNKDCGLVVHGVTPLEVPLASGNGKFVADSSLYTQFKHLKSMNLNYNDKTGGGDESNASQ
jgi:hypothetical protein